VQMVTMMGQMFESGKVTLSTNNEEKIEVRAVNKRIEVNADGKEMLKKIISNVRDGRISRTKSVKESSKLLKTDMNTHKVLFELAEELMTVGITVTFSYKGNIVAKMGADASGEISRLVTGTKAIEINSLTKLIELGI
jgi:hypothetical protein